MVKKSEAALYIQNWMSFENRQIYKKVARFEWAVLKANFRLYRDQLDRVDNR